MNSLAGKVAGVNINASSAGVGGDAAEGEGSLDVLFDHRLAQILHDGQRGTTRTVSYTHLDVYKRQDIHRLNR